jgi:CDP-glucose 4,6-dehydratase
MSDAAFWNGRRVLVTGHTGFKGAWLCMMLLRLGAKICGIALAPSTQPSLFELLALERDIDSRECDVRDPAAVDRAIETAQPDVVFHLAAQALVRPGYERPVETFATNVLGTAHVLESLRRRAEPCAAVVVTSDKCYLNREWLWAYRENEALGGNDPYSASKAAAEHVAHAYAASYGGDALRIATARAGNVIGGGDWAEDRLVPDVVRAAIAGQRPILRYPDAVRPWQHVLEPLAGYLLLAQQLVQRNVRGGAWNFGPSGDLHLRVAEIAETLLRSLGREPAWDRDPGAQPHEAQLLHVDSAKARAELGWRPQLNEQEMIGWTAAWYAAWNAGEDVRAMTNRQIDEHAAR